MSHPLDLRLPLLLRLRLPPLLSQSQLLLPSQRQTLLPRPPQTLLPRPPQLLLPPQWPQPSSPPSQLLLPSPLRLPLPKQPPQPPPRQLPLPPQHRRPRLPLPLSTRPPSAKAGRPRDWTAPPLLRQPRQSPRPRPSPSLRTSASAPSQAMAVLRFLHRLPSAPRSIAPTTRRPVLQTTQLWLHNPTVPNRMANRKAGTRRRGTRSLDKKAILSINSSTRRRRRRINKRMVYRPNMPKMGPFLPPPLLTPAITRNMPLPLLSPTEPWSSTRTRLTRSLAPMLLCSTLIPRSARETLVTELRRAA